MCHNMSAYQGLGIEQMSVYDITISIIISFSLKPPFWHCLLLTSHCDQLDFIVAKNVANIVMKYSSV